MHHLEPVNSPRRNDDRTIRARLGSLPAELDRLARRADPCPSDDGDRGQACLVERFPSGGDEGDALGGRKVVGFSHRSGGTQRTEGVSHLKR
jgi:hypothetical protein